MVTVFKNRNHLSLFPVVWKCASKDRTIDDVSKRAQYDSLFSTQGLILSGPGDLFIGRDVTIRRTSSSDTVLKLNNSIQVVSMPFSDEKSRTMMFSLKRCAASAAFKPTLAKN